MSLIFFAVFAFLVGCSDPQNYEVAKLTSQQRTRIHQVLTADQSKKLDDWINRRTITSKSVPPGVTVEQALREQDDWLAKKNIEEAKADELRRKAQVERAAKGEKLSQMLSVTLVSKRNKVQVDERKFVALEIAYRNKTDKDIQGVKGVLKLTDIYGDAIIDIPWSYDGGISAQQAAVEHDTGAFIDKSIEPQVKLWNTDFEKIIPTFEVNAIIFKDGTSMNDPDLVRVSER
jgi:hypothetical protein